MARKIANQHRIGVARFFIAAILAAMHGCAHLPRVDTDAMLDVSVSIRTISHVRTDEFGDSVWEAGSGSGFLVSAQDCEVWTSHHVIADAALIEVLPRNWVQATGIPATVVSSTPRPDVAILRMAHCEYMPQATLGNSDLVHVGDETYAVGNPLGHNPDSISRGIISHTERYTTGVTRYLQTDAAINRGNSGGALFNASGEVIGVNTALAADSKGSSPGVGYAVPINTVKSIAQRLRNGSPSWGTAGFDGMASSLSADQAELVGVRDGRGAIIITKSPAEGPSAGLVFAHDVIVKINNIRVTDAGHAMRVISAHGAGETVTFDLIRSDTPTTVAVTLAEGWQPSEAHRADQFCGYLGMTLEDWGSEEGELGRFETPVITKIHSLGPAHKARISSSQRTMGRNGIYLFPYQLDVKTVTGVVLDGQYSEVTEAKDVDHFAAVAFDEGKSLLLEIELWVRPNPLDYRTPLRYVTTAYFRVTPAPSGAYAPKSAGGVAVEAAFNVTVGFATLSADRRQCEHE